MSLYTDHCGPIEREQRERAARLRQALRNPPKPKPKEPPPPSASVQTMLPPAPPLRPVTPPPMPAMLEPEPACVTPPDQDIPDPPATILIPFERMEKAVAAYFGLTIAEIHCSRRTNELVQARQTLMYLAKKYTTWSFTRIAKTMAGRDHTTILHGVHRVEALLMCGHPVATRAVEALTGFLEGRSKLPVKPLRRLVNEDENRGSKPWSEDEREKLRVMRRGKLTARHVAFALGRSERGVLHQAKNLGIPFGKK